MAQYAATILWQRNGARFTDNRYPRAHRWMFDGGADVPASASPHIVPVPLSDPAGVDPEEAFVASLSSCHMLWFLSIAARRGVTVERYTDHALGEMGATPEGHQAMLRVTLRPDVQFAAPPPSRAEQEAMHEEAHDNCFIARSVRTEIRVEIAGGDPASIE